MDYELFKTIREAAKKDPIFKPMNMGDVNKEVQDRARKMVGSGKLPNRYYVFASNSYNYFDQENKTVEWAGDHPEIWPKEWGWKKWQDWGYAVGMYDTYQEAIDEANTLIHEIERLYPEPAGVNQVTIEDHLVGTIYEFTLRAKLNNEPIIYETDEMDNSSMAKRSMEKKGQTFEAQEDDTFKRMKKREQYDMLKAMGREEKIRMLINKRFEAMDDYDQSPAEILEYIWRNGYESTPYNDMSDEEIEENFKEDILDPLEEEMYEEEDEA